MLQVRGGMSEVITRRREQTMLVVQGSHRRAGRDMRCSSLSGKRRCHLVGICSAFLGLLGVGLVKAGHAWVVFGSASSDFFALESDLAPLITLRL